MTETVFKLADGYKLVVINTTGPSSYSSGGFTYAVKSLRKVEKVIAASASGGYKVDAADISVSGNTLTIKVYYYDYDATADGAAVEATGDLSGVNITIVVIGS